MTDILKKPIHIALLKPTHLQSMEASGKLPRTFVSNENTSPLPAEAKTTVFKLPKVQIDNTVKKAKLQVNLRVVYDTHPPIPKDKTPPCDTCVAVCCTVFAVNISKQEYDSGLFGDNAVEITPEIVNQLGSSFLQAARVGMPMQDAQNAYYLEGKIGERCPFLTDNNKCGIYATRPMTCRSYTCIGDDRITDDMRAGKVPLDIFAARTYK